MNICWSICSMPWLTSLLLLIPIIAVRIAVAAPVINDITTLSDSEDDVREKRETFDMIGMLSSYGYLARDDHDGFKGQLMSNEVVTEAIREFQRFNGLEVTGEVDTDTIHKMQSPRCGFPDIIRLVDGGGEDNPFGAQNDPQAYRSMGNRWHKDTIYWKPTNLTEKLGAGPQWTAFQRALDVWAQVTPLKFRYTSTRPDMEIKFARGDHGDGWQNKFDGRGRVLAHAYGPGSGIGGDTHFDDDETWTIGSGVGHDLTQVAAHEFGHALGLGHSAVPGALMAPYYIYRDDLSLHQDDITGIQSLYGPRITTTEATTSSSESTSTAETTETTATPTTTTTTTPTTTTSTTTTTTTTTTEKMPWIPEFCRPSFRVDAVIKGQDGYIYIIRERLIYKIGQTGLELHFPKFINDVFPGAPRNHIRAATYVPTTGKTYIFKDTRVWRFTGFDLDPSYPKIASNFRPSSAITFTNNGVSQIFLFGYDYFWEWNTRTESVVPGYPLSTSKYFPSARVLPDASYMNDKGNLFFFKYNRVRVVQYRGAKAVSYPIGPSIFGPVCGIDPQNPNKLVTLEPPKYHPAPFPLLPAAALKYEERNIMDIIHEQSAQGQQPNYQFESSLISSLLMNTGEGRIGTRLQEEAELDSDGYVDIGIDDIARWL